MTITLLWFIHFIQLIKATVLSPLYQFSYIAKLCSKLDIVQLIANIAKIHDMIVSCSWNMTIVMSSKINFESEAKKKNAIFGNGCAIQYFFFFNNCILAIAMAMRLRISAAALAAAIFFYIDIFLFL